MPDAETSVEEASGAPEVEASEVGVVSAAEEALEAASVVVDSAVAEPAGVGKTNKEG